MKYGTETKEIDVRLDQLVGTQVRLELLDVFLNRGSWAVTKSDLDELTTLSEESIVTELDRLCNDGFVETDEHKYWLAADSTAGDALQDVRDSLFGYIKPINSVGAKTPKNDARVVGSPFVELFRRDWEVKLLGSLLDSDADAIPRVLTRGYVKRKETPLVDIGMIEVVDSAVVPTDHLDSDMTVNGGYRLTDHPTIESFQTAVNQFSGPKEKGFYCDVGDTYTVTAMTAASPRSDPGDDTGGSAKAVTRSGPRSDPSDYSADDTDGGAEAVTHSGPSDLDL